MAMPDSMRKRVLTQILDFLRENEGRVTDDFPSRAAALYLDLVKESGRMPTAQEFTDAARTVKTRFFTENHRLTRAKVLGGIAERLNASLGKSKDLGRIFSRRSRVFVSHSNIFPKVYQHFAKVIHSVGLEPVIAEKTPNYGRSWNPGQKVEALMRTCGSLVAVMTPDDPRTKLPRLNVGQEIGLAGGLPIPIIYLKAKEAELPSNIRPVYISFPMAHPEEADDEFVLNLKSLEL